MPAAAPIEEDAVNRRGSCRQRADQRAGELAIAVAAGDAETPQHRAEHRLLERSAPPAEQLRQCRRISDQRQATGKLSQVPLDRLRLAAKGGEAIMAEGSGGEARAPPGREAPRAIIEGLAGD